MKASVLVITLNSMMASARNRITTLKNPTRLGTRLASVLFGILPLQVVYAQQNFCSLVPNGLFTSSNYSSPDPVKTGKVAGWVASHGSPRLNSVNPLSNLASPEIEAATNTFILDIGSGLRTENKISFKQGKKYYIVFNYRNNNGVNLQELNVALVADAVWGTTGNTLPLSGLTGITAIGSSLSVPSSISSWTKKTICFTAPYNSADLWFYAKVSHSTTTSARIGIDNVEIYEDFDFCGSAKTRFTCDAPVSLGFNIASCAPINTIPTYSWRISGTNTVIATSSELTVFPASTTTYTLTRDNGECIKTDSVKVVVSHIPVFTLGADTTLCQCAGFTLDPGIRNACYSYVWNDGYVGVPRIISENINAAANTLSQKYTLTITDMCAGCSYTKSITLNYKPVPNCKQRAQVFCENEFPNAITTKGIGKSYSWSWVAAIAPSAPFDGKSLTINSIGQYVCMVTDSNTNCTYGYDTILVQPWDSMPLEIVSNRIINPCYRQGLYLVNSYDYVTGWTTPLNWYKDGVFKQTSAVYYTMENGTYSAELISPYGLCVKRDTFKLQFIDPPLTNLAPIYGSFCKNQCDTVLDFTYCDTCSEFMGQVMSITWSGSGVTSRKVNSIDKYFFCSQKAQCGNNLLTATIIYTKFNIICTTYVHTNAYKVCPLQLDSITPLCASDGDVNILNQGSLITNAQIIGKGVYQQIGTKYFKFSPLLAGTGLHTITYYYSDSAGCSGWDSIKVRVYGKPTIKLWVGDCANGLPTWNVLIYAAQADPSNYRLESSEWTGTSNYSLGYNANFETQSFWGSTKSPSIEGHTYWFKVTNGIGCSDSAGITLGKEKPIHLTYVNSTCITDGVPLSAYYNTTLVNGTSYPGTLAFIWDDNDTAYISSYSGTDKDYAMMLDRVKENQVFASANLFNASDATHMVYTLGWHKIRVLTLGGCEYTDSVLIPFNCSNCKPALANIVITTFEKWDNQEKIINGNIIIEAGGNLELNNCNLHFAEGSKIIVKNNYGSSLPSGTLAIINSTLDGCSSWKGIEVWGSRDLYDWNGTNINLGDDPRTMLHGSNTRNSNGVISTHSWAWVYVTNSVIKDADIAIFVGKYDDLDDKNYSLDEVSGGMAFVNNCVFKNNYVDVVFTPRPGAELISGHFSWDASYIVKCTFDSLRKAAPVGSKMYWCDENGKINPIGSTISNQSPECRIVDLTETLFQDRNDPLLFFAYTGKGFNYVSGGMNMVKTTLKRDERIPYTLPHAAYVASPMPMHLGVYSLTQIRARFQNIISGSNCNNW